ncbi:hypothetical protein F5Y15DRAFT_418863 [Xylariaceae sp. FL0016]|nr:hypothetical protein F5Y15DRAFT_418863 [Xylariaceae sp. FL0016]
MNTQISSRTRTQITPQPCDSGAKRKRADTSSSTIVPLANKRTRLGVTVGATCQDVAAALNALEARFDVQLQSVISSSKIRARVASVLRHLSPTSPDEKPAASKTKIAALRARAADAGKLITIAEVAKREVEKAARQTDITQTSQSMSEEESTSCRRWYQYIALGEEVREVPRDEGKSIIDETILGGRDEDGFEVMKTPFERAIEKQPMVRGIPIMTLFLCRVSVEELKRRYGEQTNAP